MALPAYKTQDALHFVLAHSRDTTQTHSADTVKRMNEINNMQRVRHLTMDGSGYNGGVELGEILGLGQKPRIETSIERNALSSLTDNDLNNASHLNFQLDLIDAAGTMVAQIEAAIREVLNNADRITPVEQQKFITLVHNQSTLEKISDGRLIASADIIAKLAHETVDLMQDLGQSGVLPQIMREVTSGFLRDMAIQHHLPEIGERLDNVERLLSPTSMLAESIQTVMEQLQTILETGDIDDNTREEISAVLAELNAIEDGTPLSRDTIKALEKISETLAIEGLTKDIASLKEANLTVKAEQSGLSLAQVKSVEALMDRLDIIRTELGDNHPELSLQIKQTIDALDARPAAMDSLIKLTQLDNSFKAMDKTSLSTSVVAMIATAQEQTKFVTKIQTDTIARKLSMDSKQVTEMVNLYVALDGKDAPKSEAVDKIKQAIAQVDHVDTDMGRLVGLTRLQTVLQDSAPSIPQLTANVKELATSVTRNVTTAITTQITRVAQKLGITTQDVKNIVDIHQSLDKAANDPKTPSTVKQQLTHMMETITRTPIGIASIAATQMLQVNKTFQRMTENMPHIKDMSDKLNAYVAVSIRKTATALKTPASTVFKLVDAAIVLRTTEFPKTLQKTAGNLLKKIETAPLTINTTAALSQFVKTVTNTEAFKASPIIKKLDGALTGQLTHISRQVGLLPSTIKSALSFVNPEKSIHNIATYGKNLIETPKAIAQELKAISKTLTNDVAKGTIAKLSAVIIAANDAGARIRPAIVAPLAKLADGVKEVPQAVKEKLLAIKDMVQQGFKKPQPAPTAPQPGQPSGDPFANFQQAKTEQAPSLKDRFKSATTTGAKAAVLTESAVLTVTRMFKKCNVSCGSCPIKCGETFSKKAGAKVEKLFNFITPSFAKKKAE